MAKVFISYRREDTAATAGRINDVLTARLGRNSVFVDIHSLKPGEEIFPAIERAVTQSDVMLVLIGPNWLRISDGNGQRRLENPDDAVRLEIEMALRSAVPIIPVLVQGAAFPRSDALPESLRQLAYINGLQLRPEPDFRYDLERLVTSINALEREGRRGGRRQSPAVPVAPSRGAAPSEVPSVTEPEEVAASVSAERQAELEAVYTANKATGRPPYAQAEIVSAAEVRWILKTRGWLHDATVLKVTAEQRPDLSQARLVGAQLQGIELPWANLAEADLSGAQLPTANLEGASLDGAHLDGADLSHARLLGATLRAATLFNANLQGADMRDARLADADLKGSDLRQGRLDRASFERAHLEAASLRASTLNGANLSGAFMEEADFGGVALADATLDSVSVLANILVDGKTQLDRVAWGGVKQKDHRGEKGRAQRIARYRDIARQNRRIAVALRAQGLLGDASQYRLREQHMERKALLWEGHIGSWLFSCLLDLVAGYGEKPGRAFRAYVVVVLSFAGIYWWITQAFETKLTHLSWDEAIVLSLTSFHGRGFFPGTLPLGDWVARLAAGEAVIGLFIELAFIATFSRRFLGS